MRLSEGSALPLCRYWRSALIRQHSDDSQKVALAYRNRSGEVRMSSESTVVASASDAFGAIGRSMEELC
jgi:hypothetical protein